ncbi:Lipoyl synthase [Rickettsiales endosymbiont of Paramecium tredecaurelia]|uniref:lipoyl synthase n=1 Tax=Candidatus Sarmatiella mevalonica TaxID=2770581 RepID=UPI001924613E|nr:lipoyl synthase [Candidatus Sarmatiella mevalonica]MBL3284281.1 Lipoyl synthase [Candidatus Sarmatiella mevalonica]
MQKPTWIKTKVTHGINYDYVSSLLKRLKLSSVCQSAACPNIWECWGQRSVTFMLMGSVCTRRCAFCNVAKGKPMPIDVLEPIKIALVCALLRLKHVVITSVDRDDLFDGGAMHFAKTIDAIRNKDFTQKSISEILYNEHFTNDEVEQMQNALEAAKNEEASSIEVLTPDFLRKTGAVEIIAHAQPDVFNHNIETVPQLYKTIRPVARYSHSLDLLRHVKTLNNKIFTKSGFMVGLGETFEQTIGVLDDLRQSMVDFVTIGQYLQPSEKQLAVSRYWSLEEFAALKNIAISKGFAAVECGPMVRSSYKAYVPLQKIK